MSPSRYTFSKGIDITPNGVLRPGSLQDYRVFKAQDWFAELPPRTTYIRFWVDWPTLQPSPSFAFGDPNGPNYANLTGLDEQIKLAKADGFKVILLPYRYPRWVNGTTDIGPGSDQDLGFHPEDRAAGTTYVRWYYDRTQSRPNLKALEYRLPDGHGPKSLWGRFVKAIFDRWVAGAEQHGRADAIDVCNEPNFQLWPQRGPSADQSTLQGRFEVEPTGAPNTWRQTAQPTSEMTIQRAVAEMMMTVDKYARAYRPRLTRFAPSASDTDSSAYRLRSITVDTPYNPVPVVDPFAARLLDELDRIGFKGGRRWVWSFHAYNDWENAEDRVTYLRAALVDRWRGRRPDEAGGPVLAATEGGVRLSAIRTRFGRGQTLAQILENQAKVIQEGLDRFGSTTGVGAGVVLLTQYTVTADPNFDCGLREANGAERPAWDVWNAASEVDKRGPEAAGAVA